MKQNNKRTNFLLNKFSNNSTAIEKKRLSNCLKLLILLICANTFINYSIANDKDDALLLEKMIIDRNGHYEKFKKDDFIENQFSQMKKCLEKHDFKQAYVILNDIKNYVLKDHLYLAVRCIDIHSFYADAVKEYLKSIIHENYEDDPLWKLAISKGKVETFLEYPEFLEKSFAIWLQAKKMIEREFGITQPTKDTENIIFNLYYYHQIEPYEKFLYLKNAVVLNKELYPLFFLSNGIAKCFQKHPFSKIYHPANDKTRELDSDVIANALLSIKETKENKDIIAWSLQYLEYANQCTDENSKYLYYMLACDTFYGLNGYEPCKIFCCTNFLKHSNNKELHESEMKEGYKVLNEFIQKEYYLPNGISKKFKDHPALKTFKLNLLNSAKLRNNIALIINELLKCEDLKQSDPQWQQAFLCIMQANKSFGENAIIHLVIARAYCQKVLYKYKYNQELLSKFKFVSENKATSLQYCQYIENTKKIAQQLLALDGFTLTEYAKKYDVQLISL